MSEDAGKYAGKEVSLDGREPVFVVSLFVNAHGGVGVRMRADDKMLAAHEGAAAVAAMLSETISKLAGPKGPTKQFTTGTPGAMTEGGE